MMDMSRCNNVEDVRVAARRRLPSPIFNYLDGGADDEWSLRNNVDRFDRYSIIPQHMTGISDIDMTINLLGFKSSIPLMLSPTGMSRLFHHQKERAVATAAADANIIYGLSSLASTRMEDVAAVSSGPKMFQIYIMRDRELTREFVTRARASGYQALCVTVDTPVGGNRERDLRTGMIMPPRFTAASLASFIASPYWSLHYLQDPKFPIANIEHRVKLLGSGAMSPVAFVNSQIDGNATWDDVAWLAQEWNGPFVVKGVQTPQDSRRAVSAGATAIMISNHGGRQLDHTPAPIDCVRPIRDAIGSDAQIIVDGGIRRGSSVLKAIALGADACSIGRPYLYGLAAGGAAGVTRVLEMFRSEINRNMILMGKRDLTSLNLSDIGDIDHIVMKSIK